MVRTIWRKCRDNSNSHSMNYVYISIDIFGWFSFLLNFLFFFELIFRAAQSQCLGGLLIYFSGQLNNHHQRMAIWYGIGLILCAFVSTTTSNPYQLYAFQTGMKIRVLCTSLIYRKVIGKKKKRKERVKKTCWFIQTNETQSIVHVHDYVSR